MINMKKIFAVLAILISLHDVGHSQFWVSVNNFQKIRGVWPDSTFILPMDTTKNKVAGSLAYRAGHVYQADGTKWAQLATGSGSGVTSFKGRIGVVVPNVGDYSLNMLGDVSPTVTSTATDGQVLRYNTSSQVWENSNANTNILDSVVIDFDGLHPETSFALSHSGFKNLSIEPEDENVGSFSRAFSDVEAVLTWQVSIKGTYKFYVTYYY
jgi:hypothetical protein